MRWVIVGIGGAIVVAVVGWFTFGRRHPENSSGHATSAGDAAPEAAPNDRPAGPGAESEAVVDRGSIAPAPRPSHGERSKHGKGSKRGVARAARADRGDEQAVTSEPVDTGDGEVIIEQQNVGPGNQVGGGEFKNVSRGRSPEEAAADQEELEGDAPIGKGRRS